MEVDFVKPDVWLQSQGERPQFYQNLLLWSVSACCSFGYYAWVKRCPRALLLAASLHNWRPNSLEVQRVLFQN